MIKFILIVIGIMVIIAIIDYFKVFFIALAVLTALGFIAYKIYKKKKITSLPEPTIEPPITAPVPDSAPARAPVPEPMPAVKTISEPETVVNSYEVAGVVFYLDNLLSMAEPNYLYEYKKQDLIDTCNYDVNVYKTVVNATNLELTHEPDNPHDPNAIKVLLDGKLVGYIAAKDCKHILEIMDNDLFVSATCEVYGGKYKRVNEDYDWEKDKSTYSVETGMEEYGITIYIREKTQS